MSNFRILITNDGKHPASKWAELAADEIIDISAQAPTTLMREAMDFRAQLVDLLTDKIQYMMDFEQTQLNAGKDELDLPYESGEQVDKLTDDICVLAKGTSFGDHFEKDDVHQYLKAVCEKFFQSAMLVERLYHHSEKAQAAEPETTETESE